MYFDYFNYIKPSNKTLVPTDEINMYSYSLTPENYQFNGRYCNFCENNKIVDIKQLTKYVIYNIASLIRQYLYCNKCQRVAEAKDNIANQLHQYVIPDLSNIIIDYHDFNPISIEYVYLSEEDRKILADTPYEGLLEQI